MELEDYRKLRNELEKDYFLIGRRAFFGGNRLELVARGRRPLMPLYLSF